MAEKTINYTLERRVVKFKNILEFAGYKKGDVFRYGMDCKKEKLGEFNDGSIAYEKYYSFMNCLSEDQEGVITLEEYGIMMGEYVLCCAGACESNIDIYSEKLLYAYDMKKLYDTYRIIKCTRQIPYSIFSNYYETGDIVYGMYKDEEPEIITDDAYFRRKKGSSVNFYDVLKNYTNSYRLNGYVVYATEYAAEIYSTSWDGEFVKGTNYCINTKNIISGFSENDYDMLEKRIGTWEG